MIKLGTKHIRVFFMAETGSGWLEKKMNTLTNTVSAASKELLRDESWAKTPDEKLANDLINELFKVRNRISGNNPQSILNSDKFKGLSPQIKKTTQRMIDFGELDFALERSSNRLQKVEESIKGALKGEDMLMYFSNGKHETLSALSYKNTIRGDISKLNINVIQGILKSPGNLQKYVGTFDDKTWGDIAMYIEGRGYDGASKSRLIEGLDVTLCKTFLGKMAETKRKDEKSKIDPMLGQVYRNFGKSPEIQGAITILATNIGVPMKAGEVDIKAYEKLFLDKPENKGKDERLVMKELAKSIDELTLRTTDIIKKLSEEREKMQKRIGKRSISEFSEFAGVKLEIYRDGKNIAIEKMDIIALRGSDTTFMLSKIGEKYGQNPPKELVDLIILLALQSKLKEEIHKQGSLKEASQQAKEGKRSNEKKVAQAGKTSEERSNVDDAKKATGSISDKDAWKKSEELRKKEEEGGFLTTDEERMKANLNQRNYSTGKLAQTYTQTKELFGEAEAQRIFTQSNQIVSGNLKETYNFQALEKIAILTDPESTLGQKALARIQSGESISMSRLLEGEMQSSIMHAPELQNINISKNPDGTYNIPTFNATRITKKQVEEYKKNTSMYAELGLSQFIPHIPLISAELRAKGVNTAIDGKTGTMEQQQVLKALYTQLFGKQVLSSSIGDVERAYSSALGNPTNMKNAMQHTLKIHKLIPDSGRAISADILTAWIRKNNTDNRVPDPSKNLT